MPKFDPAAQFLRYPPGHYYSPLPDREEFQRVASRVFGPEAEALPGIELREWEQLRQ